MDIRSSAGKDDLAVALAVAAMRTTQLTSVSLTTIELLPCLSVYSLEDCRMAARCKNWPDCTDGGICLGFVDEHGQL